MEIITRNYSENNGWDHVQMQQKKEDESLITTGRDFQLKTKTFDLYDYKGEFFPKRSFPGAIISDVMYGALFIPHTFFTGIGNAGVGCLNLVRACKAVYEKRQEKDFSYQATFMPVAKNIAMALKAYVLATAAQQLWTRDVVLIGTNAAITTGVASLTLLALYSAWNPLGAMYRISQADRLVNVRPLTDGQVVDLTWPKTVEHILDGSYSLTRLLNIHYVGNVSDKVTEDKRAFVKVQDKKDK